MTRRASPERIEAAALQAGRRMVARGERPGYRIKSTGNGWQVDALPWLPVEATNRRDALGEARVSIAQWLGVAPDAFDLEADSR